MCARFVIAMFISRNSDRIESQLKAIGEKAEKKKMEVSDFVLSEIDRLHCTHYWPAHVAFLGHQVTDRIAGAAAAITKGIRMNIYNGS